MLGGISESTVLHLIKKKKLPCIRLTRHTFLFDTNAVKKWTETRPIIGKTKKQQEGIKKRKLEAEIKRQQKEQSDFELQTREQQETATA